MSHHVEDYINELSLRVDKLEAALEDIKDIRDDEADIARAIAREALKK